MIISLCIYFFNDDFKLNFGQREERKTVDELMCYEHYRKYENKEDARQHPFQDVRPEDWKNFYDMFEDP